VAAAKILAVKVGTFIHMATLPFIPTCLTDLLALFVPVSNALVLLKLIICELIFLEQSTSLRYLCLDHIIQRHNLSRDKTL
jgi:hypothetical protein